MKMNDFAVEIPSTHIPISTKLCQAFPRYEPPKIGLVSFSIFFHFFFSSRCQEETGYPIALKFDTQNGGNRIMPHLGTKFG